ncbi:MAG: ABC transporter permease [Planctomycetota bacterium]
MSQVFGIFFCSEPHRESRSKQDEANTETERMTDAENQLAPSSSGNSSALLQLTLARLREFYRQPEAVFWVYFFPILMVVALGVAFRNKPVEQITVDVLASSRAEELLASLQEDERVVAGVFDAAECKQRLRTAKSELYVDPTSSDGSVIYAYDPTRPGSVVARDVADQIIQRAAGRIDPVTTSVTEVSEPGGRYIDFLVPGLLGMGLMGGGLWGVGFAIVDLRIRKLLKRFVATPMKKSQFLLGIMISRLFFMVPEILLLVVFAWLFFGVRVYGNWLAIIFVVLLAAFEFAGIGLLVASRAKTMETVSGLMNLVMLPMWTLCGIFFSYERFPQAFHPFIKLLPLTPVNDALRAVMLDGASLASQWPEVLVMATWGIITFALALRLFKWNA